jgi:hypothetical protein
MYPVDQPYALMSDHVAPAEFNVLLFVDKVTAAHKNQR